MDKLNTCKLCFADPSEYRQHWLTLLCSGQPMFFLSMDADITAVKAPFKE